MITLEPLERGLLQSIKGSKQTPNESFSVWGINCEALRLLNINLLPQDGVEESSININLLDVV